MSLILSKKHGLNPSMSRCPLCGEAKDIILTGARGERFAKELGEPSGQMPMYISIAGDMELCPKCIDHFKKKLAEENIIGLIAADEYIHPKNHQRYPCMTGEVAFMRKENLDKDCPQYAKIMELGYALIAKKDYDRLRIAPAENDEKQPTQEKK